MKPSAAQFFVVGLTHIDLAWKKTRQEHEEILEANTVRLLDVLDHHPDYTYLIEQAAHYRTLAKHRPDLIARLRDYLQQGRLEFVGGLASTLETNGPNGESFVRNQLLGLKCIKDLFGVTAQSGYLIDTFGVHAQVPQILRQFGLTRLLANRFGGVLDRDVFTVKGLDGSRLLIVGRDSVSPYVRPERVFFMMAENYDEIDALFLEVSTCVTDGPVLVMPYTEYTSIASPYIARSLAAKQAASPNWQFATLNTFFDALTAHRDDWPEFDADLNPEFSGTFSLRVGLRCLHRQAGMALIEAEKWAALMKNTASTAAIQEAWWKMAYAESHDVYTGSHPTAVYVDTINQLNEVETEAVTLLASCVNQLASASGSSEMDLIALNGLPWVRDAIVSVDLPEIATMGGVTKVHDESGDLPFEVLGEKLFFRGTFSGVAAKRVIVTRGNSETVSVSDSLAGSKQNARISNGVVTISANAQQGLKLTLAEHDGKPGQTIGIDIILQEDRGNFQIEDLVSAEISSRVGKVEVEGPFVSPLRERLILRGSFPATPHSSAPTPLSWELECAVYDGKPGVDLVVRLNWQAEASRARLKVTTGFESSEGIFEIPFGAVRRLPYHTRKTAKGEWPVQRWVAIEESERGVALINKGNGGAEVLAGVIRQTLLRAPHGEYAGMIPDDTSSQHGIHQFEFAILPYAGSWSNGKCIELGQETNTSVQAFFVPESKMDDTAPFMTLSPSTVVLSTVKAPEDGNENEIIVRFYEATGQKTTTDLFIRSATHAWHSSLTEGKLAKADCVNGCLSIMLDPFEIKTVRLRMS